MKKPQKLIVLVAVLVLATSACSKSKPKATTKTTLSYVQFAQERTHARNEQAKSNLRNAYTNAKAIFVDSQDWGQVKTSDLYAAEPSLTFQAAPSKNAREISVLSTTAGGIVLAAKSGSGTCYDLEETAAGGAQYGTGSCDAANIASVAFNADPTTGGW